MTDAFELLEAARRPVALGCVRPPVVAIVERLSATRSRGDKRLLYAGLRGLLARSAPMLSQSESDQLAALIGCLEERSPFDRERDAAVACLRSRTPAVAAAPGVARALLVSTDRSPVLVAAVLRPVRRRSCCE